MFHSQRSILLRSFSVFFLLMIAFGFTSLHGQVNTGATHYTSSHGKQIIGYVPQWDAWKSASAGYSQQGLLNQLNLDYSQYTILNFSFEGVAKDGSLHSADLRNKQIHLSGQVQEPGQLLMTDSSSSWDYWILFGDLEPQWELSQKAIDAGYIAGTSTNWEHPASGTSGNWPIPMKKSGGSPGLIELCHNAGKKCMVSIGGWSMCKHFPEMAADPIMRARFINDCKRLINLGFDGIDLDWEYPGPFAGMNFMGSTADYANYTTLVTELRAAIGPDKLITAAFSAASVKTDGFEWAKLDGLMDYFNIMSYDLQGGWANTAGHNSPLYGYTNEEGGDLSWHQSLGKLLESGIRPEKITMGLAFYGRGVVTNGMGAVNAPTVKTQRNVNPDGTVNTAADFTNWPTFEGTPYYARIIANLGGWTKSWDNEAQVPYLTRDGAFLSYDDPRSVGLKSKYVKDHNLGGVIIWTAFGDVTPGAVDGGSSKLGYSSTSTAPLVNEVNNVLGGEDVTGESLASAHLAVGHARVVEGNTGTSNLVFTVTLSAPSDGSVTVDYTTSDGSAIAGSDYTAASGSLTFANGETSQQVTIAVSGDTTEEDHETLMLTLTNASGAALHSTAAVATGVVVDDDKSAPASPLFVSGESVPEGNSGTSILNFTISLSTPSASAVTLDYATSDGTATAGTDYTATSGSLSFVAGETRKTIPVTISGDTAVEASETIIMTLSNVIGATLFTPTAIGTITDDDTLNPSDISISGISLDEGNSGTTTANLTVTLSPAPTVETTVDWAVADGSATAPDDFTASSGTLIFAAGQTSQLLSIEIVADDIEEPSEDFSVNLSNAVGGNIVTASATVTIRNDDSGPPPPSADGWTRHYEMGGGEILVEPVDPTSTWASGFSGSIKLTNNSGAAITSWTLEFDADSWSTGSSGNAGSWTVSSGRHTVTQPTWLGYSFGAAASINLDFTGSGTWVAPTNIVFNGVSVGVNPNNTALEAWQTTHGVVDATLDSNGNHLPDLIDFLLGNDMGVATSPVSGRAALTVVVRPLAVDGVTRDYFCVDLDVDPFAQGVEYRVETSDDLVTWNSGSSVMLIHESSSNPDGSKRVVWRAVTALEVGGNHRFARLQARVVDADAVDAGGGGGGDTGGGDTGGGDTGGGDVGPAGAPNVASLSVQNDWADGIGHKVQWNTWGGEPVTEWKVYQNGTLVHTGTVTGSAPQTATWDFNDNTIGAFSYVIELTNSAGTSTSAPKTYLTAGASPMNLAGKDNAGQSAQVAVSPGTSTLTIEGGIAPYTVTVNHPAALSASISGDTITLTGTAGMRSGLKITDSSGADRLIGVRVDQSDGSIPGLPDYLSLGSVSEDGVDLDFFSAYDPGNRKNRWVDYRYLYMNGGVKRKGVGWRTWTTVDGDRMRKFVRESVKRGMIPVIVWYNIPDGGESYTTDLEHMQEEDYMQGYFEDLKFAIDIANEEARDEMVIWVLEPDLIGYMAQNNEDPTTLMAQTNAVYDMGVLDTATGDPLFPDTLRGMIEAINYTIKKHANNAYIGWQFNLWANPAGGWLSSSHIGTKGLMHVTDTQGMVTGRETVRNEGLAVADYYISCGVLTHGADFVSIDKYGLDGAAFSSDTDPGGHPENSTWFWNAEHWGNYLHYVDALNERTGKQVMLWQLPVGHINSSQLISPYTGVLFPDLKNIPEDGDTGAPPEWEDSAPSFFLGDRFKPGTTNRYDYFKLNRDNHARVTIDPDGETLTWGSHMTDARDSGVHIMLFGDGVGNSTHGRAVKLGDSYWWITAAQKYYENPVPLAP